MKKRNNILLLSLLLNDAWQLLKFLLKEEVEMDNFTGHRSADNFGAIID